MEIRHSLFWKGPRIIILQSVLLQSRSDKKASGTWWRKNHQMSGVLPCTFHLNARSTSAHGRWGSYSNPSEAWSEPVDRTICGESFDKDHLCCSYCLNVILTVLRTPSWLSIFRTSCLGTASWLDHSLQVCCRLLISPLMCCGWVFSLDILLIGTRRFPGMTCVGHFIAVCSRSFSLFRVPILFISLSTFHHLFLPTW